MRELILAFSARVPVEEVDEFGEREDGYIACEHDADNGDSNEEGFDIRCEGVFTWGKCEDGHAEVNKDKIFGELREHAEDVFSGALGTPRHGMVGVVLEGNPAEEEGNDSAHLETVREEV